ncbi:calponin homology domain-containing protein DDB_G0272472-like [Montipora capricornis]|uniref:calponin homology domain-containing protein DDB_G0272472-like n=1 Tax=Montipora capricornis TaxID=246305 RepID=UPI0035F14E50
MIPTEEQVKEQVKITAQHAIDTIQSTAEILNNQLQAERYSPNIKSTTDKLQDMNKQMVTLTQKGERNEKLEEEKRQLERELKMYKKAAVQQRKEMFSRRSSIRKDQTQQWKLVAGEMVDMLNMVRNAGNLDRETLEQELNRILMTLNTQTECIDNLKRDLSKQEKAYKNLEKDKNRLNDDKTLVEDQLRAKQQELKQCKQYLRKVMAERKDAGEEKIKTAEDEIHLTESAEEVIPEDALTTDILKAQVRDARKLVLKLEEENKELQRKLAALSSSSEGNEEVQRILVVHQESTEAGTLEPNTEPVPVSALDECPRCHSYKEQIANQLQGFKSKEELIERLKRDLKKLRTLLLSIKDTSNVQSELAMIEEVKEERFEGPGSPEIKVSEDVSTELQLSSENESSEDEAKEIQKPKKTGKVTTSAEGESKKLPGKSSRKGKSKKAAKLKQKGKEDQSEKGVEKDNEEDKEEKAIDMDKDEDKGKAKKPKKKEGKGAGYKPKRVLVGECREEKAPYVKVREARMVTLANKGTQTSHYDHLAESTTRRNATEWQPLGRRKPLAETIMAGVTPSEMQEETRAASLFIKEQADRLCDEISSFVECGYSLIEQGAKSTRMMMDTHLGQNAAEMLENDDPALQLEIAKEIKALQSCSHRRQSFFANKRRRSSVNLERRGTRRHSKLPFFDGLRRESRADSVTGQENTRKELEAESVSSNKELEVGSVTEQSQSPDGSKKESQDQQTSGEVDQYSKESETRARSRALSISTQGSFDINQPVFDSTFVNNSPWSTLQNFADSLTSYTGAACSHVVNSVRLVVEGSGMIPTEEQVKEQVKITAQHAIDTIQSTAEILNNQLQAEAGVYENFFALWSDIKEVGKPIDFPLRNGTVLKVVHIVFNMKRDT